MFYIFIFLLIITAYLVSKQFPNTEVAEVTYWILYACMALVAGFRYDTGTDYFVYVSIYEGTNDFMTVVDTGEWMNTNIGNAELGYMFITSVFKNFGAEINVMFFFISLISLGLVFKSISDYCNQYRFLIILGYFCFCYFVLDMGAVRQLIAVSIYIYAYRYILKQQLWKYITCAVIASLFHNSGFIIFPLYWLINRNIASSYIYILTVVGLIIIVLKISLLQLIVQYVFEPIIPGTKILYKLLIYSSEDGKMLSWGFNIKVILYIMILFFATFYRNQLSKQTPYFNILLNSLFVYVLVRQVLWESADINNRINYYFVFGLIFILPMTLSVFNGYKNKLIVLFGVIFLNFYQANNWFLEHPTTQSFNPYQNYIVHKIFNFESDGLQRNIQQKKIKSDIQK